MRSKFIPNALALGVFLALNPFPGHAQENRATTATSSDDQQASGTAKADEDSGETQDLDRIVVTGSRIKRTDYEGVEPLQVFSAEDLKQQGHATLYDALTSLTVNTGVFIGEESTNNFNANAKALNLRGFGPGYTLVLLNGRRMPIMPKPSGPVSGNVINLAMIPYSAVERVEVLSSGASAIYGSDAVAGVVNIILKEDVDTTTLFYKRGGTLHGGGASDNLNLSSGFERGQTRVSYGLEWERRRPIRGDQREWFASPERSPDPEYRELDQVMSFWDRESGWGLLDIGNRCEAQGYEAVRPGWAGPGIEKYCGDNVFGTYTIRNGRDRIFGFANLSHSIGNHELYATLMSAKSDADAGLYRYSYGVDYDIVDDVADSEDPGYYASRHIWRAFREHEVPTSNQTFSETSNIFSAGVRGTLGDYDYNVNFSYGNYRYKDSVVRFDDQKMLSLLFGKKGVDWSQPWEGARWLQVNRSVLDANYLPTRLDYLGTLTPDMFANAVHTSNGDGRSSSRTFSADISGDLFQLPGGAAKFALLAEGSQDTYSFLTDLPTVNGEIYGWSGIRGQGKRNRYAVGGELSLPLTSQESRIGRVEAKLAARYDYYDDASDVSGAMTYEAGLSWRPTDAVLFRASRATSFRAPDMHVMFAERSSSYTTGVDYYTCVQQEHIPKGGSWQGCADQYGTGWIREYSEGDPSLHEETGYTSSIGMVAQIGKRHSLTLDAYRIHLDEQVGIVDAATVLRYAAECQLGYDSAGRDVDASSPKCREMTSRVFRGGPGNGVISVTASPFNTGMREQDGIDFTWQSQFDAGRAGEFSLRLGYTHIFKTLSRYLPEDAVEDIRDLQWNNEFRTRANATLGWSKGGATGSLFFNRLGSSPSRYADGYVRLPAWTTTNLSLGYRFTESFWAGLNVTNLFDKKPPRDKAEAWWPFADISKYDATGTEYFVSMEYRF